MSAQVIQFPNRLKSKATEAFFEFAVNNFNHWREEDDDEIDTLCRPMTLFESWTKWAREEDVDEFDCKPDLAELVERIYRYNARYAPHWSDHQQYIFDHFVNFGASFEEAAQKIENEIQDWKDAEHLPEKDRMLFLAARAMFRAPKLNH